MDDLVWMAPLYYISVAVVIAAGVWLFCKLTPCRNCPEKRRFGCVVACPDMSARLRDDRQAEPAR